MDSVPALTAQSEVQGNGLGGGSLFGMDGVAFGMEVCLDHGEARLDTFYRPGGGAKQGDPLPQVLLIPSCGMNIGSGPIRTVPNGYVFNVDGGCYLYSVLRVNDGQYSCDKHIAQTSAVPGECTGTLNEHGSHWFCRQPHNVTNAHRPFNCWCFAPHTPAAPGQCPCGQNLIQQPGGAAYVCPRNHSYSVHRRGACWCAGNHTAGAPGACPCGRTYWTAQYHHCPQVHNLGGAHRQDICWCGALHTAAVPGNCACGQAFANWGGGWFGCPRMHSNTGIHDNGACWCGNPNHALIAPGACPCGATLVAGTYHACIGPHNQALLHGAGTCAGACTQTHTAALPGTCVTCARPLSAGQVHACPGYFEQFVQHHKGAVCPACPGQHTTALPGACPVCNTTLEARQVYYCDFDNLNAFHMEGPCVPCGGNHTQAAPGACAVCNTTMTRRVYYHCGAHGAQFAAQCASCNTALAPIAYYYCDNIHNLAAAFDAAGVCATCNRPHAGATFFTCPEYHNQRNPQIAAGPCGACGTARRAVPYFYCADRHNQNQLSATPGACPTCTRNRAARPYFYCSQPHALMAQQAAGGVCGVCATALVAVDYHYCPEKHAHWAYDTQNNNCAHGPCLAPKVGAYDTAYKRIGTSIAPSWGPTDVNAAGVTDANGAVQWNTYFRSNWGRIRVYPVRALPPGQTVP
jgi:hypothetical protein